MAFALIFCSRAYSLGGRLSVLCYWESLVTHQIDEFSHSKKPGLSLGIR